MCGQAGDDNDVRAGEAGRRCALEGDKLFEEEAGKVKVIASMSNELEGENYVDMVVKMHEDEDEMQRRDVHCALHNAQFVQ